MTHLALFSILLFLGHAIPSAPGVRPWLLSLLGRPVFMTLYSILSLAILWGFVAAYRGVENNWQLFPPIPQAHLVLTLLMPIPIFLVIGRMTTKASDFSQAISAKGIYRITRAPGSVGLLIWASLHLLATADAKRVVTFATLALIALYALLKNEWVLRRDPGEGAASYRNSTSIIPGAAIVGRRQLLSISEIGVGRVLATIAFFALLLWGHPLIFGVDPLAWLAG